MTEEIEDAILVDQPDAEEEVVNSEEFEQAMLEDRKKQYEELVLNVMKQGNMSRRNAVRFIKARNAKMMAQFQKQVKANQGKEKPLVEAYTEEEMPLG